MSEFEAEPAAGFSPEEWAEVARSISFADLPLGMKQAISQTLFDHALMGSGRHNEAKCREALNRLVNITKRFRCDLNELWDDLRPESIIDQVDDLTKRARVLKKAAKRELKGGPSQREADRGCSIEMNWWNALLVSTPNLPAKR